VEGSVGEAVSRLTGEAREVVSRCRYGGVGKRIDVFLIAAAALGRLLISIALVAWIIEVSKGGGWNVGKRGENLRDVEGRQVEVCKREER